MSKRSARKRRVKRTVSVGKVAPEAVGQVEDLDGRIEAIQWLDAAEKSQVRVRKTVRSIGEGDDAKIFQEAGEDTVLPDPKRDA